MIENKANEIYHKDMITIVIPTTIERYNNARTNELVDSIIKNTRLPYRILVYVNEDGGWVKAVHNALAEIDGFVVLLGDDVIVHENWLDNLWAGFCKAFPKKDGCAQPFDEINGGRLCQHPLGHSRVILKYLDTDFIHNFSDNWMTERLVEDGKYTYVPDAKIEHKHWVNKKAVQDKTYQTVMSTYETDRAMYIKKHNDIKYGKN